MRAARWCAFISGRGSNLGAILDARRDLEGLFELALVVSSRADAQGLARARRAGVPSLVLPSKIDWPAVSAELRGRKVARIFLAGFMRIVPPEFCREWSGQLFNLHPSLLPAYPGLNAIARAHADGAEIGATVHEAVEQVDAGRIVAQRRTLAAGAARSVSAAEAEMRVHRDEQRLVRAVISSLSAQASPWAKRARREISEHAGQHADQQPDPQPDQSTLQPKKAKP